MNGRLLWLEIRRNEYFWLFPVAAGLWVWITWFELDRPLLFWSEASLVPQWSLLMLSPFTAACAAWVASRERRYGLDDLVATTPRSELARNVSVWAGAALLGGIGYLAVCAVVLVRTAPRAGGDGPYWTAFAPGLAAMPAAAALGFALGRGAVLRNVPALERTVVRLAPILAAVGLMLLSMLPLVLAQSWLEFLSPMAVQDASPWYGIQPDIGLPQAVFLLGVGFFGLCLVAMATREHEGAGRLLIAAVLTATTGIVGIAAGSPANGSLAYGDGPWGANRPMGEPIPYDLVCRDGVVTVCVHPAYEPMLDDFADTVDALAAPLHGLPGLPPRFEQVQTLGWVEDFQWVPAEPPPSGVVPFEFLGNRPAVNQGNTIFSIAEAMIFDDDGRYGDGIDETSWDAQNAVLIWLLTQAGFTGRCDAGGSFWMEDGPEFSPAPCEEAARFGALDPAVRDAWLAAHYADLRAGQVGIEDLP